MVEQACYRWGFAEEEQERQGTLSGCRSWKGWWGWVASPAGKSALKPLGGQVGCSRGLQTGRSVVPPPRPMCPGAGRPVAWGPLRADLCAGMAASASFSRAHARRPQASASRPLRTHWWAQDPSPGLQREVDTPGALPPFPPRLRLFARQHRVYQ